MADEDATRYLSTNEVAWRLDVEVGTVSKWIRDGRLRARKLGDRWRVPEDAIEELLSPADD